MGVQEMVSQRKNQLALTYKELAEKYRLEAEDLQGKLHQPDQLKMTEGERQQALQMVDQYLQE
ncbi:MAG: hypothetical protein ACNS62_02020, partial [Candidatus Cyclobacteriaceae bacterium M3_2C_046]